MNTWENVCDFDAKMYHISETLFHYELITLLRWWILLSRKHIERTLYMFIIYEKCGTKLFWHHEWESLWSAVILSGFHCIFLSGNLHMIFQDILLENMIFIFWILGSPKTGSTPKASTDGEGKQGSLRVSKRLSAKGSTAALQSELSSPAAAEEQPEVCRSSAWYKYTYFLALYWV